MPEISKLSGQGVEALLDGYDDRLGTIINESERLINLALDEEVEKQANKTTTQPEEWMDEFRNSPVQKEAAKEMFSVEFEAPVGVPFSEARSSDFGSVIAIERAPRTKLEEEYAAAIGLPAGSPVGTPAPTTLLGTSVPTTLAAKRRRASRKIEEALESVMSQTSDEASGVASEVMEAADLAREELSKDSVEDVLKRMLRALQSDRIT